MLTPRNGRYWKIAHRGASDYAPENTLKAYDLALKMGADFNEVYVYLTGDGHPVLIHDADVSRTANGTGAVSELALELVQKLDAGEGERIPTFQEAMDLVRGRGGLYVELKGEKCEGPVVEAIRKNGFEESVIVGSFDPEKVRRVGELASDIQTSFLIRLGMTDWVSVCLDVDARYAHFCWESAPEPHTLLDAQLFATAEEHGLGVVAWHEERPEIIQEIVKRPIAAICGNKPDLL